MNAYQDLVALAGRARDGGLLQSRSDRPASMIRTGPGPDPGTAAISGPGTLSGSVPPTLEARPAAVLLLFGALDEAEAESDKPLASAHLDVLLVERAATLTDHPGQVAFPGGGVDPTDASVIAAALREAREETGLDPTGVEVLGTLPQVHLAVSNFSVTPVLGWWASPTPVSVVDFGESAQVFRVPVRDLLDPANRYTTVLRRGGRTHRGPAFAVRDVLVWGFTAGILSHVFDELGWSVSWDATRTIPAPVR